MSYQLTSGALQTIINGENIENPILQILSSKKIPSSAGAERYRLLLSDGQLSYSSVMLATQLNSMMEDGSLDNMSVIKVNKYLCNIIQNDKKVIIVLDLSVIAKASEVGQKIGNPKSYRAGEAAPAATENNTNCVPAASKPPSVSTSNRTPLGSGPVVNNKPPGLPTTPVGGGRIHAIAGLSLYQNRGELTVAYYVSRATLKMANKKFSSVKNDFEMTFNSDTVIELCTENTNLPTITYDFRPLKDLDQIEPNTIIDVIGVVTDVADITTVVGRQSNKEFSKRDLQLADQSGMSVRFTIWGGDAENFQDNKNPVVAVKGAKVSEWGGRTLSLLSSGQMILNPDIREAHFLRGWYDRDGCNMEFNTFQGDSAGVRGGNEWKTLEQVKTEKLGASKPDYFTSKATVIFIKKGSCMYMACPNENCNKKLIDQGDNQYRCEKCNQEFPNFKWRLILSTSIADHTGSQWITCFQECAESILGVSSDALGNLKDMDEFAFDQVFQEASFKSYIFNLRAKFETYNDESRLKTICVSATPVDWKTYGQRLIKEINNFGTGE
eukprot:XP_014779912.1 PREDICTED: replication protein A 70 kDa DNA-binding subunit-like [Octopus bimaculoides]